MLRTSYLILGYLKEASENTFAYRSVGVFLLLSAIAYLVYRLVGKKGQSLEQYKAEQEASEAKEVAEKQ